MEFNLGNIPRWFFSFAALIVAVSMAYGMFFAKCTTYVFGLQFGESRPCEGSGASAAELDLLIKELGTRDRNSISLTITNQSGGDTEGCPEGSYVSAIEAPGGVGGKFATDGINKIKYRCSPIAAN